MSERWPKMKDALYCNTFDCSCKAFTRGRYGFLHGAIYDGRMPPIVRELVNKLIVTGDEHPQQQEALLQAVIGVIKDYKPGIDWEDYQELLRKSKQYFNDNYEDVGECLHINNVEDVQRDYFKDTDFIIFEKKVWRKKDE